MWFCCYGCGYCRCGIICSWCVCGCDWCSCGLFCSTCVCGSTGSCNGGCTGHRCTGLGNINWTHIPIALTAIFPIVKIRSFMGRYASSASIGSFLSKFGRLGLDEVERSKTTARIFCFRHIKWKVQRHVLLLCLCCYNAHGRFLTLWLHQDLEDEPDVQMWSERT